MRGRGTGDERRRKRGVRQDVRPVPVCDVISKWWNFSGFKKVFRPHWFTSILLFLSLILNYVNYGLTFQCSSHFLMQSYSRWSVLYNFSLKLKAKSELFFEFEKVGSVPLLPRFVQRGGRSTCTVIDRSVRSKLVSSVHAFCDLSQFYNTRV